MCSRNFTAASDGAGFRTFVDIKISESRAEIIEDLAQQLAIEGFQSVSANKEIGVISAQQLSGSPPRPCPINVTVKHRGEMTHIEVVFQLGNGLKTSSSAVRQVMCQLLSPILPAGERVSKEGKESVSSSGVSLASGERWISLTGSAGQFRQAGFEIVAMFYLDFPRAHAAVATTDKRPRIHVVAEQEPQKQFAIVKLDSDADENSRSLKIGTARRLFKSMFSGNNHLPPDPDWTLAFESTKGEGANEWILTAKREVKPGEYGVFDLEGYILFDFEVK
jgi:hypothetical protein